MTLKSSDLPDSVKQTILAQVREQVRDTRYEQMVNALGVDGLTDLVIRSLSQGDSR